MRLLAGAATVVVLAGAACTKAPDWRSALVPLPAADLSQREGAVAEEIESTRRRLELVLANPRATRSEVAAACEEAGRFFFAHELYEAAAVAFGNAVELEPSRSRALYLAGLAARELGQLDRALELFEGFLTREPAYAPASLNLGELALERHQLERAHISFQRARDDPGVRAAAVAGLGRVALASRDFEGATSLLAEALALQPTATSLWTPLAAAHRGLGDLFAAQRAVLESGDGRLEWVDPYLDELSERVRGAVSYLRRGDRALGEGELEIAERHYRLALDVDPQLALGWLGLGMALSQQGQIAASIEPFERASALAPHLVEAWFNLATAQLRMGQRDLAGDGFDRVLELDPGHSAARLRRAALRRDAGDLAGAQADLEAMLERDPEDVEALENLALLLARSGRGGEAEDLLDTARASLDSDARARLWLASGVIANLGGDTAKALVAFRRATTEAPHLAAAHFNLAVALVGVNRCDQAGPTFLEAVRLDPSNPRAHIGAAHCATQLGDEREALRRLERGIAAVPSSAELAIELARILVGARDLTLRDPERALALAQRGFDTTRDFTFVELATDALAALGRSAEAQQWLRLLLEQARAGGASTEVITRVERQLAAVTGSAVAPARLE